MEYTLEYLVDMPVPEFEAFAQRESVTNLNSCVIAMTSVKEDVNKSILGYRNDILKRKDELTKDEIVEYVNQIASLGGIIRILDEKITIARYYFRELTPSCFKSDAVH